MARNWEVEAKGWSRLVIATVLLAGFTSVAQTSGASPDSNAAANWKDVEAAMGRPGQMQPADVIKFGMPRKDLRVVVEGVEIQPSLALGSWAAYKRDGNTAMVMGDLVLTEDEVQPVLRLLQDGGIQVSAVHNHLIGEKPHVMYVHMDGHGDAVQMAKAIHDALSATKTPAPDGAPSPATAELGIAEFCKFRFRERNRSPILEWLCRRQWVLPRRSIFNRPATVRRQSPVILFCSRARSIL